MHMMICALFCTFKPYRIIDLIFISLKFELYPYDLLENLFLDAVK
jgi:hypothetical protein